jgi:ABC-type dipeptide/oligopeptide/nickel transport system permease component
VPGYILRRLALSLLSLFVVSFAVFWVFASRFDPLWPLRVEGNTTPEGRARIAAISTLNHLNDPIVERYWHWLRDILTGHGWGYTVLKSTRPQLGEKPSLRGTPIGAQLWPALGRTSVLIGASVSVVAIFSLSIGAIAATRPGGPRDVLLRLFSYCSWAVPTFLVALLLQYAFSHSRFHWFATTGPPEGGFVGWVQHLTLPVVAVSLGLIGAYSRYVRSSMLVELRAPYSVVARAKGLSEPRVAIRHSLRNSLTVFTNVLILDFGTVFGVALVADVVFGLQGMGALLANALFASDPFEIEAILVVICIVVLVFGALADVLTAELDPRIRLT